MSVQYQRTHDDDAVRSAFRYHGPFPQRWSFSDEDLEAYLDAEYDTSDDSESDESAEACETDPLLPASDRKTSTPSSHDRPIRKHVLESYYRILEPRRRSRSPMADLMGPKCSGVGCVALILVSLGMIYLGLLVLRARLFADERGATSQIEGLT